MTNFLNTLAEHWYTWQFAMLWQMAVLIGVIWIIDLLIRKWAHPQVRYALWMLILVKLLIPPTWTSPASITSHIPATAVRAATVMERLNTDTQIAPESSRSVPASDTIRMITFKKAQQVNASSQIGELKS